MRKISRDVLFIWITTPFALGVLALIAIAAQSYRVTNGTSNQPVYEWSTCKRITNSSGKDVFVPTKTSAEWSSFYNKPPSGVSLANPTCAAPSSQVCGTPINNECGVVCNTGNAFNASQCAPASTVDCPNWGGPAVVTDSCGNSCGYSGTFNTFTGGQRCNTSCTDTSFGFKHPNASIYAIHGGETELVCLNNDLPSYGALCGDWQASDPNNPDPNAPGNCFIERGDCSMGPASNDFIAINCN